MSSKLFLFWCLSILAVNVVVQKTSYPVSVMQINAHWNEENSLYLDSLTQCNTYYEWFEDQPKSVRENLPTLPIVVIYWEDKEVATFTGNITLRSPTTLDSIQNIIDSLYLERDRYDNRPLLSYP